MMPEGAKSMSPEKVGSGIHFNFFKATPLLLGTFLRHK